MRNASCLEMLLVVLVPFEDRLEGCWACHLGPDTWTAFSYCPTFAICSIWATGNSDVCLPDRVTTNHSPPDHATRLQPARRDSLANAQSSQRGQLLSPRHQPSGPVQSGSTGYLYCSSS